MNKKFLFFTISLFTVSLLTISVSFASPAYVRPEKIIMVWDYISGRNDNQKPDQRIHTDGLDVVSPTWFSLKNRAGDITSMADSGYVLWAHGSGIKVWAVFENRSDTAMTQSALSGSARQKKITAQIVSYARQYRLDGINIDFESINRETGKNFESFIAGLYAQLKPLNITLSIDLPLSLDLKNEVYDINQIAKNCDYIVMMAYDQHYLDSGHAGPVAEIGWVKQGIEEILKYVNPDKVILGIPFYTRIWTESMEGANYSLTSAMEGMEATRELFRQNTGIRERSAETGQVYAEYKSGQKRIMAWLEDEHSLSLKLDAVNDYELAGMSAWRAGWEWQGIWDLINAYFE